MRYGAVVRQLSSDTIRYTADVQASRLDREFRAELSVPPPVVTAQQAFSLKATWNYADW